jgi:Fe-S-cluster-containing dehydrogenase component
MGMKRRNFLKGFLSLPGLLGIDTASKFIEEERAFKTIHTQANAKNWEIYLKRKESKYEPKEGSYGVLFDATKCIGCRRCEWACNEWNKNPNQPIENFERSRFEINSVFEKIRRPSAGAFTVVNRFDVDGKVIYVKKQCMHCLDPACASSCFVGAFTRTEEGAVIYNPTVCVGCRYCMVACPFDIPAYEYYDPLTPQVTKCTMCFDRMVEGKVPACVAVCSADALKFGKREDLLKLAHKLIADNPDRYFPKVYGEDDFGGTSWLYLSPVPFEKIGLPTGLKKSPAVYTRNYLFAVKVLEILASPVLVYLAYKAMSKKGKDEE